MEQSISERTLGRAVRIIQLLDIYGGLLTEKQRRFVDLHYGEDLSFGEIAREAHVSRQAVHDAVKHAEDTLEEYESNLHLLRDGLAGAIPVEPEEVEEPKQDKPDVVVERLTELRRNIQRQGIIYNSGWIVAEINKILEMLR